jgi:hypothetical protein
MVRTTIMKGLAFIIPDAAESFLHASAALGGKHLFVGHTGLTPVKLSHAGREVIDCARRTLGLDGNTSCCEKDAKKSSLRAPLASTRSPLQSGRFLAPYSERSAAGSRLRGAGTQRVEHGSIGQRRNQRTELREPLYEVAGSRLPIAKLIFAAGTGNYLAQAAINASQE